MINPEKRAELLRPRMMKEGKYLIARIKGTGQDPRHVGTFFRYYDYIDRETEFGNRWMDATRKGRWSPEFIGLSPDFMDKPLKEVKKLEFQNPPYTAAFAGGKKDPKDYNRVFVAQASGCTYACNFCYVPAKENAANPLCGNYFSSKEIVEAFNSARKKSREAINVLRVTGGEILSTIPEMVIDVYRELEKGGESYLWIDTNLSTVNYMKELESDLKNILRRKNVGIVGCFKGVSKEDFSKITGASPEYYKNQFESAELLLKWKTDLYLYLPALVYGNRVESKLNGFMKKLQGLKKNLPLRVEMLDIRTDMGKAAENLRLAQAAGRPMPSADQRLVFDAWYNKLLPKYYSAAMLNKFCCEVPL
ncbi:MAG: 4Fe-4S cluster-binding domain-containing protein [Candidatus Aenigmatarchaeota archaeon]